MAKSNGKDMAEELIKDIQEDLNEIRLDTKKNAPDVNINDKGKSNKGNVQRNRIRSKSEENQQVQKNTSAPAPAPAPAPRSNRNYLQNFGNWARSTTKRRRSRNNSMKPKDNNKTHEVEVDAGLSSPATNECETGLEQIPIVRMITTMDADEYFMNHPRRGKAIILNHENFEKEEKRTGTQSDVNRLKHVLPQLKFEVEVHNDLEYGEIMQLLKKLRSIDYTDCDCIAFFILTHGNKKREVCAKDVYYSVEKLWDAFTGDNCITLAGKPKLFFVSACRGKKKDSGLRFFGSAKGRTETDSSSQGIYKIPKQADFLIAYSTSDGYYSFRDSLEGTWFIHCLCEALLEHFSTKDLLKILTITARKVAINFQSQAEKPEDGELKQVPSITSMLIRDLHFRV